MAETVNENLKNIMLKGFDDVWNISKEEKVTMRNAAFMLSIKKIAKAVELRGIFP